MTYAYEMPFSMGNDMGPQPWSPGGVLGDIILPTLFRLPGMTDRNGQPFLQMPTFGPDRRTIPEMIFAENTKLVSRQIQAMDETARQRATQTLLGQFGSESPLAKLGMGAVGQILQGAMQMQDPTAGSLQKLFIQNSMMMAAGITGGQPFSNPAQTAQNIAAVQAAVKRNIWGDGYTRNLDFTYGLSEAEIAPLMAKMVAGGRFNSILNRGNELRDERAALQKQLDALPTGDNASDADKKARERLTKQIDDLDTQLSANQVGLETAVERAGRNMNKVVTSMKALYGSAKNAAAVLEQTYGQDIYGPNGDRLMSEARVKANQMIAIAAKYGFDPQVLGANIAQTSQGVGAAFGFGAEEQAAGFGGALGTLFAEGAVFSARQAAGDDKGLFQKLLPGYNKRSRTAAGSHNARLQVMLQYAHERGLISDDQFRDISQRISSGDRSVRAAAIREMFEQGFGGYSQGLDMMNDANGIALMADSLSNEGQKSVYKRTMDTVGREDRTAVQNAAYRRRVGAASNALRNAGMTAQDIQRVGDVGAVKAMEDALGKDSEIVRGASAVKTSALEEARRMGLQGEEAQNYVTKQVREYYEDSASVYLDPEQAEKVAEAGRNGAAQALENKANSNGEAVSLGRKIEFALRRRGWSRDEIQKLRDARNALRSGKVDEAQRIYQSFIASAGVRGQAIERKFAGVSTKVGGGQDVSEMDRGAAGTAGGLDVVQSNTMGRGTATEGTAEDAAAGEKLAADMEEKAKAGETTWKTKVDDFIRGKAAAFIQSPEANSEDFDNSIIGQFLQGLEQLVKKLFNELLPEAIDASGGNDTGVPA